MGARLAGTAVFAFGSLLLVFRRRNRSLFKQVSRSVGTRTHRFVEFWIAVVTPIVLMAFGVLIVLSTF
jgi:carbon starvation protein CstA